MKKICDIVKTIKKIVWKGKRKRGWGCLPEIEDWWAQPFRPLGIFSNYLLTKERTSSSPEWLCQVSITGKPFPPPPLLSIAIIVTVPHLFSLLYI